MKLKISTEKILIAGIVLLLLSVATIIIVSIDEEKQTNFASKQEAHIQEALFHSQKLLSLVIDNEAAARGFVLTGKKTFLEPIENSQKEIYNQMALIKVLTVNNPLQKARTDSLSYLIDKRILFSSRIVSVREVSGEDTARAIIETGEGKLYIDHIRMIIDKMQATENILLVQRKEANEKKITQLYSILKAAIFFILLLLVVFIQKVRADFFIKSKAATLLAKLNSELEQKVLERTSELEKSKNTLTETLERIYQK